MSTRKKLQKDINKRAKQLNEYEQRADDYQEHLSQITRTHLTMVVAGLITIGLLFRHNPLIRYSSKVAWRLGRKLVVNKLLQP